ncbi:hypothetical protein BQ8482_360041 [Mesorhizobium delmotii]|uniref:Uncharacterized protein n=1 Tax=Mesorhizobium delmotii TaxID=1631247 RepID=A0A2P9AR60_9HYPH|nr:hypothetical protein BQ8482_360041 [Mesorhizobium delmotii]
MPSKYRCERPFSDRILKAFTIKRYYSQSHIAHPPCGVRSYVGRPSPAPRK